MEINAIISPVQQENLQIAEFNIEDIFSQVKEKTDYQVFRVNDKEYRVNLGSNRYRVFKKSRVCACCGLMGNRLFLDYDQQQSKEQGFACYHFNLYAENHDKAQNRTYLTLMTKDHIIPRYKGGSDSQENTENYQTLCYHCNSLKEHSNNLPLENLRTIMFPAYRSSMVLNKAKKITLPYRDKISKNENAIERITEAFKLVKPEKASELKQKSF